MSGRSHQTHQHEPPKKNLLDFCLSFALKSQKFLAIGLANAASEAGPTSFAF
jgi:hypothetical protein